MTQWDIALNIEWTIYKYLWTYYWNTTVTGINNLKMISSWLFAYTYIVSDALYVNTLTVSWDTITVALTPVLIKARETYHIYSWISLTVLSSSLISVVYHHWISWGGWPSESKCYVVALSVSWTALTAWWHVLVYTNASLGSFSIIRSICKATSTKFVLSYNWASTSMVTWSISWVTITLWTPLTNANNTIIAYTSDDVILWLTTTLVARFTISAWVITAGNTTSLWFTASSINMTSDLMWIHNIIWYRNTNLNVRTVDNTITTPSLWTALTVLSWEEIGAI
jgi:hypothetical protein